MRAVIGQEMTVEQAVEIGRHITNPDTDDELLTEQGCNVIAVLLEELAAAKRDAQLMVMQVRIAHQSLGCLKPWDGSHDHAACVVEMAQAVGGGVDKLRAIHARLPR